MTHSDDSLCSIDEEFAAERCSQSSSSCCYPGNPANPPNTTRRTNTTTPPTINAIANRMALEISRLVQSTSVDQATTPTASPRIAERIAYLDPMRTITSAMAIPTTAPNKTCQTRV